MSANGTTRTAEQVTREIAREREQLAAAVSHLRGELSAKTVLKQHAPKIALVAAVYIGYKLVKFMAWQKAREAAVEHVLKHERS